MIERPILFSAPMVRALLDSSKTQTRRVVKTAITMGHQSFLAPHNGRKFSRVYMLDAAHDIRDLPEACPHGQPGDRLWVRETFQPLFAEVEGLSHANWKTGSGYAVSYPATDGIHEFIDADDNLTDRCWPSIHMPRWASRITLEITGVRVERLQDISEADAIAEGIEKTPNGFWSLYGQASVDGTYSPRASYSALWESINGPGSWDANPWVWVVEFKRLDQQTISEGHTK